MNLTADRLPDLTREALATADRARARRAEYTDLPELYDLRATEWLLLMAKLTQRPYISFERVLEIGCGHGFNLLLWRLLSDDVVGVDLPGEIEASRSFLAEYASDGRVTTFPTRGEDLDQVEGDFDLIVSQYVLEHVDDIDQVLAAAHSRLRPGGYVVHILNNAVDRLDWYVMYRDGLSPARRVLDSVRARGVKKTLRNPGSYTQPHEPKFGDFGTEHMGYRREAWAQRVIRAGWVVVDHFQSRDNNVVLVTQPLSGS